MPQMALLHWVKDQKTPSLSDQASACTLFPEGGVVWKITYCNCQHHHRRRHRHHHYYYYYSYQQEATTTATATATSSVPPASPVPVSTPCLLPLYRLPLGSPVQSPPPPSPARPPAPSPRVFSAAWRTIPLLPGWNRQGPAYSPVCVPVACRNRYNCCNGKSCSELLGAARSFCCW